MENKELKKLIKQELKKEGIDTRPSAMNISIKSHGYGDTAIRITIKDLSIDDNMVSKIISRFEKVDRDERTYEILQGCNTFASVSYDYEKKKELYEKYLTEAQQAIDKSINSVPEHCITILKANEQCLLLDCPMDICIWYDEKAKKNLMRRHSDPYNVAEMIGFFKIRNNC